MVGGPDDRQTSAQTSLGRGRAARRAPPNCP